MSGIRLLVLVACGAVLLPVQAAAQLAAVPDEHMLVATLEFTGASGGSVPALTCESRLGWAPHSLQKSRANISVPGGPAVTLELDLGSCERLPVPSDRFWVVKAKTGASAILRGDGDLRVLRWAADVSHKVPRQGRVRIGTAQLAPSGAKGPAIAIYLGLRVLEEGAEE